MPQNIKKMSPDNFGKVSLTKLVDKHQRMFSGMLQDGTCFTQLDIERTLTGHNIVIRSESGENSVDKAEFQIDSRNVATLRRINSRFIKSSNTILQNLTTNVS